MNPWKTFVRYFIPSKTNKYRPLLLRLEIASVVMTIIVLLFGLAAGMQHLLVTNKSSQTAAVIASALVDLTNNDRAQNNELSLTVNPLLQAAAQAKANDMAANGYFAHVSPTGRDPWYWFTQAGYSFVYGGENLAVYFSDSSTLNTAWMNSPEHRANILNEHYTEIGIATAEGVYQGHQTTFAVQEFGTPTSVATAAKSSEVAVSSQSPTIVAVSTKGTPKVKGASVVRPNVKVTSQDKNFIAFQNENAPTTTAVLAAAATSQSPLTTPTPKPNPISVFILKFITSPETDLVILYGIITAVIALALALEVTTEFRRPHPRRIVLGLSMIGLMIVLVFVGHVFVFGKLLIA